MKFEKEDWKLFRNIETLPQKAGVKIYKLGCIVAKELVDNALDISENCEVGWTDDYKGFYVKDDGDGIDEELLPRLFSINRPLISSKILRLPTRGALGNGLRVVVGAVIASGGIMFVSTKGVKYRLIFNDDGTTSVEKIGIYNEIGTCIEVRLGSAIKNNLEWAQNAIKYSNGEKYKGRTSGYWYSSETFYELLQAYSGKVRDVINEFDGCTGAKAGIILRDFKNRDSNTLSFEESENLLELIRTNSKKVNPNRLGSMGEINDFGYYKISNEFTINSARGKFNAEIPFVIEAWAKENEYNKLITLVNKTPITGDMYLWSTNKNKLNIYGCGLNKSLEIKTSDIIFNIITPYMPITSDGKQPDIGRFQDEIVKTINKAGKRARKCSVNKEEKLSQKDIILNNIDEAVDKASGGGVYRFSQRQLFYAIRPYVINELGKELEYGNFCKVITEYEYNNGDIRFMYRDNRGTLYHPHLCEEIPVGTISVENYTRPKWLFNKVLYIEKEGFFNILKDNKIPEKYDMALLTSKGYASRAVKDLLDTMGEGSEEEITIFCVHDADGAGTKIYDTLQNETKARQGRKIKIINLGLEPEEAISMGLAVEKIEKSSNKKAVADYVQPEWQKWLQCNRVELNAMSTPQFIKWIEMKIQNYDKGKVIPPDYVLENELNNNIWSELNRNITNKILAENNIEEKLKTSFDSVKKKSSNNIIDIRERIDSRLNNEPTNIWNEVVKEIAYGSVEENLKNCDF